MHISYVKLFRDDEGTVRDSQEANGEFRNLQHQIELLKQALEREMNTVADLRELLDSVRRIAFELNDVDLEDGQVLRLRLETDQVRDWHKPNTSWTMTV